MNDPEHDRLLRQRILQLRNQLDEITGGEMIMSDDGEPLSMEAELSFLENMIAMETAPRVSWFSKLSREGYDIPNPEILSEEAMSLELWQVVQRLSEMNVFLSCTDHLSDQELYIHLYDEILPTEVFDIPFHPDSACHIDILGSGSEEDNTLWLRYYSNKSTRDQWRKDYPDFVMPPFEKPPFNRDHLLPKRELPPPPQNYAEALLQNDFDNTGPMTLDTDLAPQHVAEVPIVLAAQAFMETLAAMGKVKATATLGNLPRAFVSTVYPHLPISEEWREIHKTIYKKLDEEDVHLLHQVRVVCENAGLVRKQRGHFMVTKKGKSLIARDQAGTLFHHLFIGLFAKTNLAYFDRAPDLSKIQQTLPVIFWRLSEVASDWFDLSDIEESLLLGAVYEEVLELRGPYSTPGSYLDCRVLRQLHLFGLVEYNPPKAQPLPKSKSIRTTPLFDLFFSFEPSVSQGGDS